MKHIHWPRHVAAGPRRLTRHMLLGGFMVLTGMTALTGVSGLIGVVGLTALGMQSARADTPTPPPVPPPTPPPASPPPATVVPPPPGGAVAGGCKQDIQTLCPDVKQGDGRIAACLKANRGALSASCRAAIREHHRETMPAPGSPPPPVASPPGSPPAPPAASPPPPTGTNH